MDRDLGFPAGKNKTMLIDLNGIGDSKRVRLRTNLEIYWDSLTLAQGAVILLDGQPARLGDLKPGPVQMRVGPDHSVVEIIAGAGPKGKGKGDKK